MNGSTLLDPRAAGVLRAHPGQALHLLAGQLWFGRDAASVSTLLGSCVGVTLWHPGLQLGGMCHFLLPQRRRQAGQPRDARFGDEAMELLLEAIARSGSRPQDFQAHLYGGADTLPDPLGVKLNVGERNIEQGWSLIDRHGFNLQGVDVGDQVPRHVQLAMDSGAVHLRRGDPVRIAA
jgi:chemotaxis protein CheD